VISDLTVEKTSIECTLTTGPHAAIITVHLGASTWMKAYPNIDLAIEHARYIGLLGSRSDLDREPVILSANQARYSFSPTKDFDAKRLKNYAFVDFSYSDSALCG